MTIALFFTRRIVYFFFQIFLIFLQFFAYLGRFFSSDLSFYRSFDFIFFPDFFCFCDFLLLNGFRYWDIRCMIIRFRYRWSYIFFLYRYFYRYILLRFKRFFNYLCECLFLFYLLFCRCVYIYDCTIDIADCKQNGNQWYQESIFEISHHTSPFLVHHQDTALEWGDIEMIA